MGFKCNEGQQTSRDLSEYIRLPLILWLMLTDRLTLIKQRSLCLQNRILCQCHYLAVKLKMIECVYISPTRDNQMKIVNDEQISFEKGYSR